MTKEIRFSRIAAILYVISGIFVLGTAIFHFISQQKYFHLHPSPANILATLSSAIISCIIFFGLAVSLFLRKKTVTIVFCAVYTAYGIYDLVATICLMATFYHPEIDLILYYVPSAFFFSLYIDCMLVNSILSKKNNTVIKKIWFLPLIFAGLKMLSPLLLFTLRFAKIIIPGFLSTRNTNIFIPGFFPIVIEIAALVFLGLYQKESIVPAAASVPVFAGYAPQTGAPIYSVPQPAAGYMPVQRPVLKGYDPQTGAPIYVNQPAAPTYAPAQQSTVPYAAPQYANPQMCAPVYVNPQAAPQYANYQPAPQYVNPQPAPQYANPRSVPQYTAPQASVPVTAQPMNFVSSADTTKTPEQ